MQLDWPNAAAKVPAGQLEHEVAPVAPMKVPSPHAEHALADPPEYVPDEHAAHTDGELAPTLSEYFPASHPPQPVAPVEF